MAVLSKYHGVVMRNSGKLPCDIIHPGESCVGNAYMYSISGFKSIAKLYFLMFVASVILKRTFKKQKLIEEATSYLRFCVQGGLTGLTIALSVCFLRWLLGRFYFTTMALIPGALGGIWVFLCTSFIRRAQITTLLAGFGDVYLRKAQEKNSTSSLSLPKELALFSFFSSCLLYSLRFFPNSFSTLWPFVPQKVSKDPEAQKQCLHKGSCLEDIQKTGKEYFCYGLALQTAKSLINLTKTKSVKNMFKLDFFRLPLFTGLYVSIFKAVSCLLVNLRGKDDAWHALPAGVAASTCYLIQPNTILTFMAFSNLAQILCRELKAKIKLPEWHWECIAFSALLGYTFYERALHPKTYSPILMSCMHSFSDGRSDYSYDLAEKNLLHRF